ncbi:hypothetical protein B0J14DRAFT_692325 [Halenospora varia]|nr:hypothetical protein B0J14DRAFT_692325 [Halenospora varia]
MEIRRDEVLTKVGIETATPPTSILDRCQQPIPRVTVLEGIDRDGFEARRIQDSDSDSGRMTIDSLSESIRPVDDIEMMDRLIAHINKRHVAQKSLTPLQRLVQLIAPAKKAQEDSSEKSHAFEFVQMKAFDTLRSRQIFEQTAPRAHLDVGFEDAFQSPLPMNTMRDRLYKTRSTKEEFCDRVSTLQENSGNAGCLALVEPLFQIIRRDAMSLLKLLHNALDIINIEILDDMKIEESLSMWRDLITRSQLELPEFKRSMEHLFSFMQILDPSPFDLRSEKVLETNEIEKTRMEMSKALVDLTVQIDAMLQRLQTASSSLTQNMALLDSRRSIAEAQAVTNLFGMQVEPLEDRAPLSTFVILGVTFVTSSYLVRLMLRSTWLRNLKQAYGVSIKMYADKKRRTVQRKKIPASLFLSWIGYEFGSTVRAAWRWTRKNLAKMFGAIWRSTRFIISILLMVSIIATAPIAVLVFVTVIILVLVIPMVAILYWKNSSQETRSRFLQPLKKAATPFKIRRSSFILVLICLCAVAIVVVPLAIVWTKPVSPGMKVGITVFTVFMVVMAAISYGLHWLVKLGQETLDKSTSGSVPLSLTDHNLRWT